MCSCLCHLPGCTVELRDGDDGEPVPCCDDMRTSRHKPTPQVIFPTDRPSRVTSVSPKVYSGGNSPDEG